MAARSPVLILSRLHLLALAYLSGLLFLQHFFLDVLTPTLEAIIALLLAALLLGLGGMTLRFNREWARTEQERGLTEAALRRNQEELVRAQEFLDTIINHIPNMIYVKDAHTSTYVLCNRANAAFLDLPREAILGRSDPQLFPPAMANWFYVQDRAVLASGQRLDIPRERIHTAAGRSCIQHTQKIPVPGLDGHPRYLLGISEDITDRVQAEEALRRSEEQYRTLVGNLSVGIYRIEGGDAGRFLQANAALAAMYGCPSVAELQSVPVRDFFADPLEWPVLVSELRHRGVIAHKVVRQRRADGTQFWGELTARAAQDERGGIRWIDGVIENITARKEAEEELSRHRYRLEELIKERGAELIAINEKLQKEVLRATLAEESGRVRVQILDAVTDAVFVHTLDGEMLHVNEAAWRERGCTHEELLRTNFNTLDSPRHRRRQPDRRQTLEMHGEVVYDSVHLVKGQPPLTVEVRARLITYADRPAVLSVARDISERKRIEKRLQQLLGELRQSNTELEQFAYVASHDLQEPLRMVTGYVQLLQRRYAGKLGDQADEFIGFAVDGAKRMQRLISDLLTYARISRPAASPPGLVESARVLDRVLGNLQATIADAGAVITRAELPAVRMDEVHLQQLFQNLIGNAIKFRHPARPPRVTISAAPEPGFWRFAVADNGIGIAPEFQARIFQVFQRLHTSAEYAGTGIGLAVCRKIVERYGGRIWVESKPGRGSVFSFALPRGADR